MKEKGEHEKLTDGYIVDTRIEFGPAYPNNELSKGDIVRPMRSEKDTC